MTTRTRLIGDRSGVVLTETAARPPGRRTRRNSERPRTGLGKYISPMLHSTASKPSAGKVRDWPSSTVKDTFGIPPRRSRARSTIAGEMSAATTWPSDPTASAAASAARPVPLAMSSARMPGARRAARSRGGMKCPVTCPTARSYPAAAVSRNWRSPMARLPVAASGPPLELHREVAGEC